MTNQRFSLPAATFAVVGFSFAVAGCILGADPNANSTKFSTPLGGNSGGAGIGGGGISGGGGSDQNTIPGIPLATFDTDTESFSFSTYAEMINLGANTTGNVPTIDFDASDASPSGGGSLKVFAPFSGANQYIDLQSRAYPATMLQNWAGGKLHVRVKVDAGSTFTGQIQPHVDTGAGFAFVGSSMNVIMTPGWHDYPVSLDTATTRNPGYDLKQVVLFGVHIGAGTAGASQGPVTFHVDSFSIEGIAAPPATDAGMDVSVTADSGSDTAAAADAPPGN